MSDKSILVMRATGVQGRGAIKHLTKSGWKVHALVTDKTSERAVNLKSFGPQVVLHEGTWKEPAKVEAALQGCRSLLFNQLPSFTDDTEIQEAKVVLSLAKRTGVQHIVFPTTLALMDPNAREKLERFSAAPAILNKGAVEELVKASGMTWTLLRPGYFNTNLLPPLVHWMYPRMKEGKMINSYGPDCVLTLIDPDDIGAFVAAAVNDPKRFGEQAIPLVGDNLRFDDLMKTYTQACGYPFEVVYRTDEETEAEMANPFVSGHVMVRDFEKMVNMEEIKKWGIPLTSFKQFLENHKDELPRGPVKDGESVVVPYAASLMPGNK
ncbi:hypothetical protein DE146DRAFT_653297 [Phaeosphaeria sp. MPI-PUGE-AT-0046c]|nr:hypothetical protein DE146DRAFT_653297 [Phaeosphaeria sp. MPI-PUGE-AT-0046c]